MPKRSAIKRCKTCGKLFRGNHCTCTYMGNGKRTDGGVLVEFERIKKSARMEIQARGGAVFFEGEPNVPYVIVERKMAPEGFEIALVAQAFNYAHQEWVLAEPLVVIPADEVLAAFDDAEEVGNV